MFEPNLKILNDMELQIKNAIKKLDEMQAMCLETITKYTVSEMIRDHKKLQVISITNSPKFVRTDIDANTGVINRIWKTSVRGKYQFELGRN